LVVATTTEAIEGRITDEDVERARKQIGIPVPSRDEPWNRIPERSSISHFAFGYGDDNPLWHDEAYARSTRWGGLIAPPLYAISTGLDETPSFDDPDMKQLFRGLFRGVGKYYSGVAWEWYRPIVPDEPVLRRTFTSEVVEKQSSFSKGRSVIETFRTIYGDLDGNAIAVRDESYVNAERHGSKDAGKYASTDRARYTPDDIAAIDAEYAAEEQRGADTNWFEQAMVGEPLVPVIKGPLTVVDIISMHMGMGWGGYGIGPLRYAWKKRQSMPAFFVPDEFGVPDVVQRLHWDATRASELGLPAPYDYGQMRTCWLTHLVTNWIGDDGWLWKFSNQVRAFNFHGDVHRCSGEVVAKERVGGRGQVQLDIRATNQRGDVTTPGSATVLLPSRDGGPVVLPDPPPDVAAHAAEMAARSRLR